jgi:hypothetical protein
VKFWLAGACGFSLRLEGFSHKICVLVLCLVDLFLFDCRLLTFPKSSLDKYASSPWLPPRKSVAHAGRAHVCKLHYIKTNHLLNLRSPVVFLSLIYSWEQSWDSNCEANAQYSESILLERWSGRSRRVKNHRRCIAFHHCSSIYICELDIHCSYS